MVTSAAIQFCLHIMMQTKDSAKLSVAVFQSNFNCKSKQWAKPQGLLLAHHCYKGTMGL